MSVINITHRERARSSEAGVVSILVTMVLLVVISLIVLGFAQVARRTQNQQLNQQLSTQAFYAAETGVNDVANIIAGLPPGTPTASEVKSDCTNSGVYANLTGLEVLSPATDSNVSYTCVTVNPTPSSLNLNVGATSSIVPINGLNGANITKLTFSWTTGTNNNISNCPNSTTDTFSSSSNWNCGYGVLRVDLVPTAGANNTANSLEYNTMTSFMEPDRSGNNNINYPGGSPVSSTNTQNVAGVKCTTANCTMTISNLNSSNFELRVSTVYKDETLQITAANGSGPVELTGAQISVDATGKAQDVLRRIRVAIPIGVTQNGASDFAMESTESICKRFAVMTGSPGYYGVTMPVSIISNNPVCQNSP